MCCFFPSLSFGLQLVSLGPFLLEFLLCLFSIYFVWLEAGCFCLGVDCSSFHFQLVTREVVSYSIIS